MLTSSQADVLHAYPVGNAQLLLHALQLTYVLINVSLAGRPLVLLAGLDKTLSGWPSDLLKPLAAAREVLIFDNRWGFSYFYPCECWRQDVEGVQTLWAACASVLQLLAAC